MLSQVRSKQPTFVTLFFTEPNIPATLSTLPKCITNPFSLVPLVLRQPLKNSPRSANSLIRRNGNLGSRKKGYAN